jgi:site-specific recombinase
VAFRDRLDACRASASSVYTHLEDNGISVGLVFRLRQLRERVLRIRELLDCLMSPNPAPSVARLVGKLVLAGGERNSIRALFASNSSMLAAKVTERSAETGEHYITRDRASYLQMVKKAAGGGALTAVTVLLKFGIYALALSAFWAGLASGLMYAASFVAIQLLHLTLATKQPAMTAPALAARLRDIKADAAVDDFVDEVANLVRSQVAAVLGNVLVVVPAMVALALLVQYALGRPLLDAAHAAATLHSLSLAGPTALFAAITGILLFSASIVAGWTENAFVLHRLDSAMRYNPRIGAFLGAARARRWATFMRTHISGFASNISLGLMLGLLPAFAGFFGLGLDVRHVTLSAGQIAAAAASTGLAVLQQPALWWAVAAIPVIGALNVSVSFYFAFRLALRAHSVSLGDRARIRSAIWARWRSRSGPNGCAPRPACPPCNGRCCWRWPPPPATWCNATPACPRWSAIRCRRAGRPGRLPARSGRCRASACSCWSWAWPWCCSRPAAAFRCAGSATTRWCWCKACSNRC